MILKTFIVKQITSYGTIYCIMSMMNNNTLIVQPILNNIYETKQEFDFNEIKFILNYRFMFKPIGISIWFHNNRNSGNNHPAN